MADVRKSADFDASIDATFAASAATFVSSKASAADLP
jgi:hypothetical protein